MEYWRLGSAGLKVSALGLGTNNFGERMDEKASVGIVHAALDAGINFIDTANRYGGGHSEEFIGKAVKGRRWQALIGTKFGRNAGKGPNDAGGSRQHIMKAIEASLRRLDTDYIDLYQMHVSDPETPIEETLRALDDLIRQGKVRYIGCSGFRAWELCEALWTARMLNLNSFVSVQPAYNLLEREIEEDLVPLCRRYNVGIIPYHPLAAGFLTGKYRQGEPIPPGTRFPSRRSRSRGTPTRCCSAPSADRSGTRCRARCGPNRASSASGKRSAFSRTFGLRCCTRSSPQRRRSRRRWFPASTS